MYENILILKNYYIFSIKMKLINHVNLLNIVLCGIASWLVEWLFLFEYNFNYWSVSKILFFFRPSVLLYVTLVFWLYIWGLAAWRRTLYGKFTRGDRKLWFKGLTSFWVGEVATIFGIFISACWMSWGPAPLMPRHFLISKRGFLLEITLFSYIIWLIYALRLSLKWYLWKTQFLLSLFIILISTYLLWRDFLTLYSREPLLTNYGSHWKYIKTNSLMYSLDKWWWYSHHLGSTHDISWIFANLNNMVNSEIADLDFFKVPLLTEYEQNLLLPYVDKAQVDNFLFPLNFFTTYSYDQFTLMTMEYPDLLSFYNYSATMDSYIFYPRKIGFLPKKLGMWYFILTLKMWHHIMLYIWWFFYLARLLSLQKTSYSLVSMCYFNAYCCFLLAILVLIYQQLPILELYLKVKPRSLHWIYLKKTIYNLVVYLYHVCFFGVFFNNNMLLNLDYIMFKGSLYYLENFMFKISYDNGIYLRGSIWESFLVLRLEF